MCHHPPTRWIPWNHNRPLQPTDRIPATERMSVHETPVIMSQIHDLLTNGWITESKFCMFTDWPTLKTLGSLHSFMSLCDFYAKYCPYFEVNLSPYRTLLKTGTPNTPIQPTDWTANLENLFQKLKRNLTSSPVLASFNSTKSAFLKTDYSALVWAMSSCNQIIPQRQHQPSPASKKDATPNLK